MIGALHVEGPAGDPARQARSGSLEHRPALLASRDALGRILVADEDPTTRCTIVSYFEKHNVTASAASNRQELRRHFAAMEPTLILLALALGNGDGLDLLREIRSHSDVPIIVMAGQRRDEI